jgi:hypothetical protein
LSFEFLLILFYLAGVCPTPSKAVAKLMKEYLAPKFEQLDSHTWRRNFFWNEKCDLVLKKNLKMLQVVYKKHSGMFALPGQNKY